MNSPRLKKLLTVLPALVLCAGLTGLACAAEKPKRGDYPKCQAGCLTQLEKRMGELSENYEKTGNRLLYPERVEQARLDYDDCIINCKELLPVK